MNKSALSLSLHEYIFRSTILVFSIVFFGYAIYFNNSVQDEHIHTQEKLTIIKNEISAAKQQLQIYEENISQFNKLRDGGFIGNSNRLQWMEIIKNSSNELEIPFIDFSIGNSKPVNPEDDFYTHDELQLEKTKMDLKFQLLHEGDWYNFISKLHSSALGLFSIDSCVLRQESRNIALTDIKAISANCELAWYSLKDVTVLPEEP